jgi:hypothetical protein
MSNTTKQPPRRPDFEVDTCRVSGWDNREDGGHINLSINIRLKDLTQRFQEAVDNSHEGDRRPVARDEKRSSIREDRSLRDGGPRNER